MPVHVPIVVKAVPVKPAAAASAVRQHIGLAGLFRPVVLFAVPITAQVYFNAGLVTA